MGDGLHHSLLGLLCFSKNIIAASCAVKPYSHPVRAHFLKQFASETIFLYNG
jgi:hypothetical protein